MDNYDEESKVQNHEENDALDQNQNIEGIKGSYDENEQIDSPLQIFSENVRIDLFKPK